MTEREESRLGLGPMLTVERTISAGHLLLVLAPMLAVVSAAISFWHFVTYAFVSNPVLNGLILSVLLWGAGTMILHVRMCFHEETAFAAGYSSLLQHGLVGTQAAGGHSCSIVYGMLQRLETLGLEHHLHIHGAAMEPEFQALESAYERRQELSNFLVGLMVGLGLLGTFVGLLETLMATSHLIGKIADSMSQGAEMESEFAKIVTGLQEPMSAMGTAFSASMFGLVGSIMLGFQAVAVRKAVTTLTGSIRRHVLSLAQSGDVSSPAGNDLHRVSVELATVGEQMQQVVTAMQTVSLQMQTVVERLDQRLLHQQEVEVRHIMVNSLAQQRASLERMESALRDSMVQIPSPQR